MNINISTSFSTERVDYLIARLTELRDYMKACVDDADYPSWREAEIEVLGIRDELVKWGVDPDAG